MGTRYIKHGAEYIKIDSAKFEIKPGSLRVRFENLFNGQKALEDIGNQVLNQNSKQLETTVLPVIERALEKRILKVANQVFLKAPAKDFFPY